MKVLLINGSPKSDGNTSIAIDEMVKIFREDGVETEVIQVGNKVIRGCIGCGKCFEKGSCVFDDIVNETAAKLEAADGLVIATPVYYASANGTLVSFLDRLFYSANYDMTMKVGASVVSCRRGGNSATFEAMNQFFGISGMPTVPSTYWNDVHGYKAEDVLADVEGVETIRNMATNMAFMIKSIKAGAEQFGKPDVRHTQFMNFIR